MNHNSLPGVAALLLPFLAGCSSDSAQFSESRAVPKSARPTVVGQSHADRFGLGNMAPAQASGAGAAGGQAAGGWTADVPDHWQPGPPAQFRDLRWFVGGDENAEAYLLASVGGSLSDNVNRWYQQQFGVTPLTPAEVAALPTFPLLGQQASFFELHGTMKGRPDTKMLLLAAHENGMLRATFRMTAPAAIADVERDNFLRVAASIRPGGAGSGGAGSGGGGAAAGAAGAGGGASAAMPPGHPEVSTAPFKTTIPAGWTAMGDSGSRMLRHSFGNGGEVYVGTLGGDPISMAGIWYGEIGHTPPDAAGFAALPKVAMLDGEATLIDQRGSFHGMSGTPIEDARILVAVLGTGNGVVFAKMVGPAADVDAQHAAFVDYCKNLQRNDG